ncbi:hypothetical protein GGI25_001217 [Coemansia spiralis]|uniref:NmrA-like domain-containing protein n=2 Tax=Coemansia TaxID=4863 RepID=A0A9W8L0I2_9FUNG|nr:hypothetical protein BX070DRAFT_220813 [Coemansia spiralis]KAJ1994914.1 hypothetical protein EDC05_001289 [Coemansia umbellata]KAJ2624648.1 hypothetical protein GGI26_001342 [Coemansia sp. RSA 1358]KAJ2679766.1 hypothetical protein GGI25_001217 [Coemansia spiralis]
MVHTVAIIGATGLQGGSVLRSLYKTDKYKLIAVTRNVTSQSAKAIKEKYPDVELVQADLDDVESLKNAFKGADTVFGMTQFEDPSILSKVAAGDLDAEFNQGKNTIDAAIVTDVKNVIFSTIYSLKKLSGGKYADALEFEGKYKIEQYLWSKADKIRGVAVQLGSYMEDYVDYARISPEDNETVEFVFPVAPTTKLPFVDTAKDTGGVVAYILDHFADFVGKPFEISGGYYEAQELAKAFQEATGKPACYIQLPISAINNKNTEQGYQGFEEFGYYGGRTDFLEINKKMDYKFTTLVDFWKNRGWTGPEPSK